tara:strand:- start:42 stop:578 length:537 start_codon:yes stop_codon:yes gene_type:complete
MTTTFTWDQFVVQKCKFYISDTRLEKIKSEKIELERQQKFGRPNVGIYGWNDDVQELIRNMPKEEWNITVFDEENVEDIEIAWSSTYGKFFQDWGRDIENFIDHLDPVKVNLDNEKLGRSSVVIVCVPYERYMKELRPFLSPGDIVFDYYSKKCYLLQNDTFDILVPFSGINFLVKED